MNKSTTKKTLKQADAMCRESGARLTEKGKRALTVLLDSDGRISAYDLKEEYESRYENSLTRCLHTEC